MSVDKRVDVLTDASLHYGEHLFYRCGMNKHIPSKHSSPLCDGYFFFSLVLKFSVALAVVFVKPICTVHFIKSLFLQFQP